MASSVVPPHSSRVVNLTLPDDLWQKIDLEWLQHQLPLDAIVSVYVRLFMSGSQYHGPDPADPS
jgi:hypothetical protein